MSKEKWHTKWYTLRQYPRCSTFLRFLQILSQPANWILYESSDWWLHDPKEQKQERKLRGNWLKVCYLLHIHPQSIFPIFLITFLDSVIDLLGFNVRIFTHGWLNVVNQVLRWSPRLRSNFDWVTTRHIPSIHIFYYWIPNDNGGYVWLMRHRLKTFENNLQFFKSVILTLETFDSFFLSFQKALFPVK